MADKELYIHIGAHKAGSTSLQQSLLDHSFALRGAGVRYLTTGRRSYTGPHYTISTAAQKHGEDSSRKVFKALATEIADADQSKLILSSEAFESLPGAGCLAAFRDLREKLGLKIRVLYIVRRHSEQLCSSYVQVVRELAISETFHSYTLRRMAAYHSRYRRCIALWSGLADRMDVIELAPANIEGYLLAEFGMPIKLSHRNRGLNILAIEALRRYCENYKRKHDVKAVKRVEHDHKIEAIIARAVEFDDLYPAFWGYTPNLFTALAKNSAADRSYLATSHGIHFEEKNDKPRSIFTESRGEEDRNRLFYILFG